MAKEKNAAQLMDTKTTEPAEQSGIGFFDRPLSALFRLNWEQGLYLLFLLLAVATRFWALGVRAMSHDESLHALFSWKLYAGEGYQHDPMMHGPFLFHSNALIYFLLGVSDYTARIVPALFGVAMVGLPYLFRRYLGRIGALVASFLILISPSLLYYSRYIRNDIYITVHVLLLSWALFQYIRTQQAKWLVVMAGVISLSIATKEVAFITAFIGVTFYALTVIWEKGNTKQRQMLQVALGALALALILIITVLNMAMHPNATGAPVLAGKMTALVMFVSFMLLAALSTTVLLPQDRKMFTEAGKLFTWRNLRLPLLAFVMIYVLLFTTFFTNPKGLLSGSVGAVSYWLAQQPVQRGAQPWYYYIFLMPFYELIPFFIGIPAVLYLIIKAQKRWQTLEGDKAYWLPFLIYWTVSSFVIYSWAGEKMPWLVVHPALPLLFVAAQVIGNWFEHQEWCNWRRGGGISLLGLFALMIAALIVLVTARPFTGMALSQLQGTGKWIGALVIFIVLAWFASGYVQRLNLRGTYQSFASLGLLLLTVLTIRFAWTSNYVNYDYTNEFLVYAHGTPDLKVVMNQIEEISRRTAGDKELQFSYDQEDVWPLEWYLKDYPNRVFYGDEPNKTAMELPVVIVSLKNEAKAKPFLGDRYYRFEYRLVWWPIEDYKGLTPAKILGVLGDSKRLDKWATIWFYRRYPIAYSDWPYQNRFAFYIRKDVLNQMWDMGVTLAVPSAMPEDPYQKVWQEKAAGQILTGAMTQAGTFNNPRGVAAAPDGKVYVLDSGNGRIVVFDAQGQYLRTWGSIGTAPGQFQDPWGITIASNGDVYVTDTWNHRVQWFDANGNFKGLWGFFADVQGSTYSQPGGFWGPRSIAIGKDGNIYVTDTGNKRVQEFTADGQFIAAFGGEGKEAAQFNEPVGLATDADGNIYVADTWNQRVQFFDAKFGYSGEWKVDTWQGSSLTNKPYLAASGNYIFASDPEGYRILVFDRHGSIAMTFGRYGSDNTGLNMPTGLVADAQGRLWVADTLNNRVLRFDNPLP